MNKKNSILLSTVLTILLLSGCLGNKNEIKDDTIFLHSVPVCTTDDMCKKMWEAAGEWVDKYSPQGINAYSDELIESEEKELGSEEMEIVVKKIKQQDGSYKILIDNVCTRSLGSCSAERNNMIAFNKKLSAFMSSVEQKKSEQVFEDNKEVKQWLDRYTQFMAGYKAGALSNMMHFPVSFIEKDRIDVLASKQDLSRYLETVKKDFEKVEGSFLKSVSIDVFGRNIRNLYVNAIIELYNEDNEIVAARQVGFHLVNIEGKWRMISAATVGE